MACLDLCLESLMPSFEHYEPNRIALDGKRHVKIKFSKERVLAKAYDLTGQKIGMLTVLERAPSIKGASTWICKCDCGATKRIRGRYLRNGDAVSCGCYAKTLRTVHGRRVDSGGARDRTYTTFTAMKGRVLNPNNPAYHNYGGRGIKICEQWLEGGFLQFLADMGERPPNTSLDRIDINGDYCPENCKWSTRIEQAQNRQNSRLLSLAGKTQTFTAWAKELNLTRYMLEKKLQNGMTLQEIKEESFPDGVNK
jgi:hypothetical protein